MKDWTGNKTSIFATLGSNSHSNTYRPIDDYYATDPKAVELLLMYEKFNHNILEPACGEGHIVKVLEKNNYNVTYSDIICRNDYGVKKNFLSNDYTKWNGDIITNPPYKFAKEFVEKSLKITEYGNKIAMFLKLQFLEGKARKKLFTQYPPKVVYISSSRLMCALNGDFAKANNTSSAIAYCWFIWEKGYNGDTILKWIN